MTAPDLAALTAARERLRASWLEPEDERPASSARGLHHVAISVEPGRWQHLKDKLDAAAVQYVHHSGTSLYFAGPDGERLELICGPLGEMYGEKVL